jgi:hypothetical protein
MGSANRFSVLVAEIRFVTAVGQALACDIHHERRNDIVDERFQELWALGKGATGVEEMYINGLKVI